jgi:hypothetical protein
MDNDIQCWWCGAPIQEHGTSEYGKLNIGFLCDHEKWVREHMPPKARRSAKPTLNTFDPF